MSNMFTDGSIKVYGGWTPIEVVSFNKEELNFVKEAVVSKSEYGKSVCFTFITGQHAYIPIEEAQQDSATIGDKVDPSKVKIVTLAKPGERNIKKVRL